MDRLLKRFYDDAHMREAVKELLIESLKEQVIEKAFKGEDVKAVAEAKEAIDRAFQSLEVTFAQHDADIEESSR